MKIEQITIHKISMPLKQPFVTAINTVERRSLLIAEVAFSDGVIGWGECSAFETPWYTEETTETCLYALQEFLVPDLLSLREIEHPADLRKVFGIYRGHHMAKSCIETAIWDGYAKILQKPLYEVIGGAKTEIEAGIAIGMQGDIEDLLCNIEAVLKTGYKRIKLKVKPGEDLAMLSSVRARFPEAPLMVDANSSYSLEDLDRLKEMDQFDLMMIEQPLGSKDFIEHAQLQKSMKTPICLDESITSIESAQTAIALGSCKVIAIKHSRVGGLAEAIKIRDYCKEHGMKVWAGGMIESGIGKAHNIALATLDGFAYPGDITASSRYWFNDIIKPGIEVEQGKIVLSDQPGIGYEINREQLMQYTTETHTYK